jgi:hypothetical protein
MSQALTANPNNNVNLSGIGDSVFNAVNGALSINQSGGGTGGGDITVNAYLSPNEATIGKWIVKNYDTYKKRLG